LTAYFPDRRTPDSIGGASSARVGEIVIADGAFDISAYLGAGIGTGFGNSSVDRISIARGTFKIEAEGGAAIGAGHAQGGQSVVGEIVISGGTFMNLTSVNAAAIGAGFASSGGVSSVTHVAISDGSFTMFSSRDACIGSGTGNSSVG
jgi:hypothetical protein